MTGCVHSSKIDRGNMSAGNIVLCLSLSVLSQIYRRLSRDGIQMRVFPRSWKILENPQKYETILESHRKVMELCPFPRSHGQLMFQGKSHGILQKPLVSLDGNH